MVKKTGDYKIPFSCKGNLMHYPSDCFCQGYSKRHGPTMLDNTPFVATLTLEGMSRGRSAAYFNWKDETGRIYPMFMSDMTDLVMTSVIANGRVGPRTWKFIKRGQNFGLTLAE